jgi:trimeric autotransporter adhesin
MKIKLLITFLLLTSSKIIAQGNCNTPVPVTITVQGYCPELTIGGLKATGTNIKWYATASGGMSLNQAQAVSQGLYYVSQTVNGCESTRVGVLVTDLGLPDVANNYYITLENEGNKLVPINIYENWYTAPEGGTPLQFGTILTQGDYYISHQSGTCESARVRRNVVYIYRALIYEDNDHDGYGNPATESFFPK